jgi:hypothetical protein
LHDTASFLRLRSSSIIPCGKERPDGKRNIDAGLVIGFDLLMNSNNRINGPVGLIYRAVQALTGRDVFAFLFMVLSFIRLGRVTLFIDAGVGTLWFAYVLSSLLPWPNAEV